MLEVIGYYKFINERNYSYYFAMFYDQKILKYLIK